MRYQCERRACGAILNTTDPPHVCKDLQERSEKQEKAIGLIERTIIAFGSHSDPRDRRLLSEAIYRVVSGRDLP